MLLIFSIKSLRYSKQSQRKFPSTWTRRGLTLDGKPLLVFIFEKINMEQRRIDMSSVIWNIYWRLTIIWYAYQKWHIKYFDCKCDCGGNKTVAYSNLKGGRSKSCWCIEAARRLKIEDFLWKKLRRLEIINHYKKLDMPYVDCKCDCWNIKKWIYLGSIKNWTVKSCWCLKKEYGESWKSALKHWESCLKTWRTRFYRIWVGMKWRCYIKSDNAYSTYGARGIVICDRWRKFELFKEDMYESYMKHVEQYWEKNTTIDRHYNDWNYDPWNCKWATPKEQANNKKNNLFILYEWKEYPIAEAKKMLWLDDYQIRKTFLPYKKTKEWHQNTL